MRERLLAGCPIIRGKRKSKERRKTGGESRAKVEPDSAGEAGSAGQEDNMVWIGKLGF